MTHEEVEGFLKWLRETRFKQLKHKNSEPRILALGTINRHHGCLTSIFNAIPRWIELGKIPKVKLTKQRNPASLVEKRSEEGCTRTRVLSQKELERLISCATPRAADIIKMAVFTLLRYQDLKKADWRENDGVEALRGIQGKTRKGYEIATFGYMGGELNFTNFQRERVKQFKNVTLR